MYKTCVARTVRVPHVWWDGMALYDGISGREPCIAHYALPFYVLFCSVGIGGCFDGCTGPFRNDIVWDGGMDAWHIFF